MSRRCTLGLGGLLSPLLLDAIECRGLPFVAKSCVANVNGACWPALRLLLGVIGVIWLFSGVLGLVVEVRIGAEMCNDGL